VRESFRAARRRVATAIAAERAAAASRLAAAEARLATARRMALQRRMKSLLAEGWRLLPAALAARWARPGPRGTWVAAALDCARAVLPQGAWRIEAPASWNASERAAALESLARHGIEAAVEDGDIDAGVRVRLDRVDVDATLAGLLADRPAIEGGLLEQLAQDER
jgi:hypothetical protein